MNERPQEVDEHVDDQVSMTGDNVSYKDPCQRLMQFFEYGHLPPHLKEVSVQCYYLAHNMLTVIPHNSELTTGLRRLLEAKDCFVRAKLYKD